MSPRGRRRAPRGHGLEIGALIFLLLLSVAVLWSLTL